jgi:hypothetical protein
LGQGIPYFNGQNAMKYLVAQCDLGPRYPGSEGHSLAREMFISHFNQFAEKIMIMDVTIPHPYSSDSLALTNIMARYNMSANQRIMLMAHWDTRAIADMDPDSTNHNTPIIGANDGASGVAILMELAQILRDYPLTNLGVDLLLVDGEDIGKAGDADNFGLGTKEFAQNIPAPIPNMAICLDMVADKHPRFPIEVNSYFQAQFLVKEIWSIAHQLGYDEFENSFGRAITDDHTVLYKYSKIPSIDIIDFEYPYKGENYWHTLEDTPENCSAETLGMVGTVVTTFLYQKDQQ